MNNPDDYGEIIRGISQAGPEIAAINLEENPEHAVRAIQLAQATGLPPQTVYNDPNFDNVVRLNVATEIIRNNSAINQYIQSDPMASIISNDDYGNLDQYSEAANRSILWRTGVGAGLSGVLKAWEHGYEGIKEGWGPGLANTSTGNKEVDDLFFQGVAAPIYKTLYGLGQYGLKALGAFAKGATGAAAGFGEGFYEGITGEASGEGRGFGRDIGAMVEMALNQPPMAAGISPKGAQQFRNQRNARLVADELDQAKALDAPRPLPPEVEAGIKIKPWIDAGIEPPAGLHPVIDRLKANANAEGLLAMENELAMVAASLTHQRDPGMFKKFVDQYFGDSQIAISGERVAELYRDRVPEPNDGLLGWVPGIAEKLELARATGEDVYIPRSDFVAYGGEIYKALREDIRMWPGGITAREAMVPIEPRAVVDSPLAQVRDAAGLEPVFMIGDRKLTLVRYTPFEGPMMSAREVAASRGWDWNDLHPDTQRRLIHEYDTSPQHEFNFVDQNGTHVGSLVITPMLEQKTLYVDMVIGQAGMFANSFGPSLIRDLKRQLKEMYPEYEYITGHRVSGARYEAGVWEDKAKSQPKVALMSEPPKGWGVVEPLDQFQGMVKILDEAWEQRMGNGLTANIKPRELFTAKEAEITEMVQREIARITGGRAQTVVAQQITHGDHNPLGVFRMYDKREPQIMLALFTDDQIGAARHETIHFLRKQGFFTAQEWDALVKAAKDEGWAERFNIETRYSKLSEAAKVEEAIAEGFRAWATNKEVPPFRERPSGAVEKAFAKLEELWEAIKQGLRDIFGRDVSWEELFEKAYSGEIAERRGTKPLHPDAFNPERVAFMEPDPNVQARLDTLRANATGLDINSYRRLQQKIQERYADDIAAAQKRAEAIEKKSLTKEWRENLGQVREEVEATIRQRPDVAADLFLGSGELMGQKLRQRYTLDAADLTPEQIAWLPKHYVSKTGGLPADDVAQLLGFPDKNIMIEELVAYQKYKDGKTPQEALRTIINEESARVMQARYGNLDDNVMTAARDRAFSETELNLIADELQGAAMAAGKTVIDRDVAKAEMERIFENMRVADIRSDKLMALVGKHGRDAERALIAGDDAAALISLQKKYMTSLLTKMAIDHEKAVVALEKVARPYQRRGVSGGNQDFVPYIQSLLADAGYRMRVTPEEIARGIEFHGNGTLKEFVEGLSQHGPDMDVAPWLYNGAKPLKEMTASEFDDFRRAIIQLNHTRREANKLDLVAGKQAMEEFRQKVLDNLTQLPARTRASLEAGGGKGNWLYRMDASLTRSEEIIKDMDLRQELGPLWDAIIRPLEEGKAKVHDLNKQLADHFNSAKGQFGKAWRKSLDDTIPNKVIWDPHSNAYYDMTRSNLIQIMLNWGTKSNIEKFVNGAFFARHGVRPDAAQFDIMKTAIENMIHTHATKSDWDFVQHMWEPFKWWQKDMDVVARNTTGIAPKWIPPQKVQTRFGELEGGYWPVRYDKLGSNIEVIQERPAMSPDALFGPNYFKAATAKGHLKERTGYVDFVDISQSIEASAGVMQQTMNDIAFREPLMQASKVLRDKEIRAAMRKHYGTEYTVQFQSWLKRIADQYAIDDRAMGGFNDLMRRARLNLTAHALPFNLNVWLSPDVGVPNPAAWQRYVANFEQNQKIIEAHSKEIKHLVYNLDRDYMDAMNRLSHGSGYVEAQKKALQIGYYLPTRASQFFRSVTFMEKFNEAKALGKTDVEAGLIADSYVRERHGTASIVDLPAYMASNEAMKMLTIFGSYFNTMRNWQRQIPGQWRRGEYGKMSETIFGTVIVGAVFQWALFSKAKEDESWFKQAAKALAVQPLPGVPIMQQAMTWMTEGYNPRMPWEAMAAAAGALYNDVGKVVAGKKVEKPVEHVANVVGLSTGLPLMQAGKTGEFIVDAVTGEQKPRNILEWMRGIRTGEARPKK